MKILLVEDEKRVGSFVARGLREEHYAVDWAEDGEKALQLVDLNSYDLIILDVMLPKRNGFQVLEQLRSRRKTMPVLMLTAKDKTEDKVEGFNTGADDYLTKPFAYEELLARVKALLRRSSDLVPDVLRVGDLEMDTLSHRVTRGSKIIDLTSREYALLEYFMRHAGRLVTRTQLSEHVWENEFDSFSNVIDVHVGRLRKKIDEEFEPKLLQTLRGSGYMLKASPAGS